MYAETAVEMAREGGEGCRGKGDEGRREDNRRVDRTLGSAINSSEPAISSCLSSCTDCLAVYQSELSACECRWGVWHPILQALSNAS